MQKKHCDLHSAETLLRIYGKRHSELIKGFGDCVLPRKDNYINLIKKLKDSACGPDGVPYSAYSVDFELSGIILENTSNKLAEENDVNQLSSEVLNRQLDLELVWFAPKGVVDEDSVAVLQFGGGCQGCGMVDVTLKDGVEKTLLETLPQLTAVRDVTDHSVTENAYF